MLYFEVGVAIYILAMFIFLLLNFRGYLEVPLPSALPDNPPPLSIIISTENDGEALRNCLASLGRQDYPRLEILIVDHGSRDDTPQVVNDFAREYPHISFLAGDRQPEDWSEKTYSLHAGALRAQGEYLLFITPNMVLQPHCLTQTMAYALHHQIDFLSLMPGYDLKTFWEKLILPIVFGWFGTRFSIEKVNDPGSTQAVAVEHFMLLRKTAYQATGGFQKVKGEILEDSALAREVKQMGLSYRLIGGKHLLTSRAYGGLKRIWTNCSRLYVGELGSSPVGILWTFLVIGLTGIAPFASVLWCAYIGFDSVNTWILLVSVMQCAMVLTARLVLDYALGIGVLFAFLQPIGALLALAILVTSLYRISVGTIEQVKGRVSSEL